MDYKSRVKIGDKIKTKSGMFGPFSEASIQRIAEDGVFFAYPDNLHGERIIFYFVRFEDLDLPLRRGALKPGDFFYLQSDASKEVRMDILDTHINMPFLSGVPRRYSVGRDGCILHGDPQALVVKVSGFDGK